MTSAENAGGLRFGSTKVKLMITAKGRDISKDFLFMGRLPPLQIGL
jgi:hypothetical protein